jgi:hypothetical protein
MVHNGNAASFHNARPPVVPSDFSWNEATVVALD